MNSLKPTLVFLSPPPLLIHCSFAAMEIIALFRRERVIAPMNTFDKRAQPNSLDDFAPPQSGTIFRQPPWLDLGNNLSASSPETH